jgi:Uma2 family endonuclease
MTAGASRTHVHADEYLAMERASSSKHELWDGEVFAMAGASLVHNVIVGNIARVLGNLLADGPCLVLPSDMKVHIPLTKGYVYPDVSVVCDEPVLLDETQDVITNPSVIVEVLSESTERFDRGDKFIGYRSLPSLRDYVLVSQTHVRVEHYQRQADQSWLLRQHGPGGSVRLGCTDGEVSVDAIYHKVHELELR